MIHRFVDLLDQVSQRTILWNIVRQTGGTDRAFAAGLNGTSTLADYLNNSFHDVNVYGIDFPDMSPDRQSYLFRRSIAAAPTNPTAYTRLMIGAMDDLSAPVAIAQSPVTGTAASGARFMQPVGWSPDSQQCYYLATDNHTDDDFDIRRVDRDGTNDTLIHASSLPDFATGVLPRISPDGTMIAHWIDADSLANMGLWVMNEDGTGHTRIYTATNGSFPMDFYGWSPDSQWLLFMDQDGSPITRSLYKIHPDGTGQTTIFADTVAAGNLVTMLPIASQHPLFTQDGSQVAVSRTNFSPAGAFPVMLDTDGSESYTALPYGTYGSHQAGPILNDVGTRAYWVETGSPTLDHTWVLSSKIDGTDLRIDDDMTDDSTTPDHDDFRFDGWCKASLV